ncbi:MAG TPA: FG-GAP-like repeat-containing protein, partial [Pirellulaceae bacterium]|nr:FG-GAP-like repeat-containing protein [Pirellulaceae bacterium]
MWFRSLFDSLLAHSQRPPTRRRPLLRSGARRVADRRLAARRLLLEGLEDRRLLAFDVLAEYPTGLAPADVALADVNGDGRPDMIVANSGGSSIDVRLGNADGTFGAAISSATGASPRSLAVGDLTGDGTADVVTANGPDVNLFAGNGDVSLLVGNGDGTFQPPQSISLPVPVPPDYTGASSLIYTPRSVATGDLNSDGKLDLVVAGQSTFHEYKSYYGCGYYSCGYTGFWIPYTDGYVHVLLGNGSGGFSEPEVHHLGRYRTPGAVGIGDLNHDGQADVITANGSDLSVLLGDGTGSVGSPIHSGSGAGLSSVSLGDLDGDGNIDTITRSSYSLIVQKGQGDGTFVPSTTMNLGYRIDSAVVGDVNADGKLDLVAVGSLFTCTDGYWYCYDGYHTKLATVALGNGQGDFAEPITSSLGTVGYSYDSYYSTLFRDVALADLTGDGLPELVTIDSGTNTAIVAKGNWPPADAPFISVESPTVVEGDAGTFEVTLTASLSAAYTQTVTANFHTADGTATAGSDYQAQSGSLTFAPGETSQTITMVVHGDRIPEADETFSILLSNVVNATVGKHGTVTILDNEPRISINHQYGIDPLTVIEGDEGTTPAVFTVSLAMPYDQEVTVDYYTLTGHTDDIIAASGTLRFAPGETSKTITVEVVGDLIHEDLEAFNVILENASPNATIVAGAGYCYIVDDDDPPLVTINDVSQKEGNKGTTSFVFTVSLSEASGKWVSVNFAT